MSVIELPAHAESAPDGWLDMLRRRWDGSHATDQWGLDADLTRAVGELVRLRWSITVSGIGALPATGPVVLVCNRRFGWTEPVVLTAGINRVSHRPVRLVGCPDIDPLGSLGHRLGAVNSRPDEIAGMLRGGQVVALPTSRELHRYRVGSIPLDLLEPGVLERATVIPVAIIGHELGRRWHVIVGSQVAAPRGTDARAVGDLAVRTGSALQELLDEAAPATPLQRLRDEVRNNTRWFR